ncbi:hypothetical protein [Chlorogloea sp. CCALA 695]|nr:hypothetical protein [Chlorogloea sp. CCALA 695]
MVTRQAVFVALLAVLPTAYLALAHTRMEQTGKARRSALAG